MTEDLTTADPKASTKERIVTRAAELFAERGYHAVSIRDIAEAVGVRSAALYHHFADKEAIYVAALKVVFARYEASFEKLLMRDLPAEARLEGYIRWLMDTVSTDRVYARIFHRELVEADPERLDLLYANALDRPVRILRAFFAEAFPNVDAYLAAESVVGLVMSHYEYRPIRERLPKPDPAYEDREMMTRFFTRLLTQGLAGSRK